MGQDLQRPEDARAGTGETVKSEVGAPKRSMFDEIDKIGIRTFVDIKEARELAGDRPAPGKRDG